MKDLLRLWPVVVFPIAVSLIRTGYRPLGGAPAGAVRGVDFHLVALGGVIVKTLGIVVLGFVWLALPFLVAAA